MEAFPFLHQLLHTRRVDSPVMMLIQICAKGGPGACSSRFFLLKWCNLAHSERSKISNYQPKNQKF